MAELDELLVEPDNENVDDNIIIMDNEMVGGDDPIAPTVGMKFEDKK